MCWEIGVGKELGLEQSGIADKVGKIKEKIGSNGIATGKLQLTLLTTPKYIKVTNTTQHTTITYTHTIPSKHITQTPTTTQITNIINIKTNIQT